MEEAAGIAGLHVRRHEAELRLNAAENNLKRADELRRQQEKQLQFLKQAEEAAIYKLISEEIKKTEAGLYFLKLKDIDHEIKIENEINSEAVGEVETYNKKINEIENQIQIETEKVKPIREKNLKIYQKFKDLT